MSYNFFPKISETNVLEEMNISEENKGDALIGDACGDGQGQYHGPSQLREQEKLSCSKETTEPQKQLLQNEFPHFMGVLPKVTKAFLTTLLEDAAVQHAMASDGLTATQVEQEY
jgi:hypothetical protein